MASNHDQAVLAAARQYWRSRLVVNQQLDWRQRQEVAEHELLCAIAAWQQAEQAQPEHATVTRLEVIDENGRAYTRWHCAIDLSYQDQGRTLKVFVKAEQAHQPQPDRLSEEIAHQHE